MSKIFKPRRGTTYTMRSTAKKSTVLAKGEMFLEVPNTGVGTGASKLIIGDGTTTYENLPVAISGTTTSNVTADSSTSVSAALNNVVSGTEMSNLFGSLKQAISLQQTAISGLNDELPFSLAINSGVYGYKDTSNNFHSFKSQADIDSAIAAARVGTAGTAQVLSGYTFTNSSSSGLNGSMTNQGTKTYTINPGGSQTIPQGYHSGSGTVTANANQNSGTYTFASGSTGATVDMGVNNTYRYVNATNVYNKGKSDGGATTVDVTLKLTWGGIYNSYTFTTFKVGSVTVINNVQSTTQFDQTVSKSGNFTYNSKSYAYAFTIDCHCYSLTYLTQLSIGGNSLLPTGMHSLSLLIQAQDTNGNTLITTPTTFKWNL